MEIVITGIIKVTK